MGIPYRKEWVKPDGRRLTGGGPRDQQRRTQSLEASRAADEELIEFLKEQIQELRNELRSVKSDASAVPPGYFSPEQVDKEIQKAVEEAVKETMVSMKHGSADVNQKLSAAVDSYKKQIFELQKKNDELTLSQKPLRSEISELRTKINEYEKQIALLEQKVESKDELIEALKSRTVVSGSEEEIETKRPQMERHFVDPLEEGAGKGLKQHIHVKHVKSDKKVDDKVDKLKGLLGSKLPKK